MFLQPFLMSHILYLTDVPKPAPWHSRCFQSFLSAVRTVNNEHAWTTSDTLVAGSSSSRFPNLGFRYAVKTWGFKQTASYTHSYKAVSVSWAVTGEKVAASLLPIRHLLAPSKGQGFGLYTDFLWKPTTMLWLNQETGFVIWGFLMSGESPFFCKGGGRDRLTFRTGLPFSIKCLFCFMLNTRIQSSISVTSLILRAESVHPKSTASQIRDKRTRDSTWVVTSLTELPRKLTDPIRT